MKLVQMVREMREMRTFSIIWLGQLFSRIGSGLTNFGIGFWALERTGSVTAYASIVLAVTLPSILLAPFAGAVVDRWDRRRVMILGDTVAALGTLSILLLLHMGRLEIWHITIILAVGALFDMLQALAYSASTSLLVPKRHLSRASGLMQTGTSVAQIVSPLLAGVLVLTIGLKGVIMIDLVTFFIAVGALLAVRIPKPRVEAAPAVRKTSFLRDSVYGWSYIATRRGLLGLVAFSAVIQFTMGMAVVLLPPLVLSFASAAELGTIMSIGSIGGLAGGIAMSTWGGPKSRMRGVAGFGMLFGICVLMLGLKPSVALLVAAYFGIFFSLPVIGGCSQYIWQTKTPPEVQGRVFAMRRLMGMSTLPIAYMLAGPAADQVFEPMLAVGGSLAGGIGGIIGVGTGRGIGLMFILVGLLPTIAAVWAYFSPSLWRVEIELPDALPSPQPAPRMSPSPSAEAEVVAA